MINMVSFGREIAVKSQNTYCEGCAVAKRNECHWLGNPKDCGDYEEYVDPWANDEELSK